MALNFCTLDIWTRRPSASGPLLLALATAGIAGGCSDEMVFEPAAVFSPENVLPFGDVSVANELRLTIEVRNGGNAGLQILSTEIQNSSIANQFRVEVAEDLTAGLTPGLTSAITVIYRPCPDAWNGDVLDDSFMLTSCPGAAATADLVITANTSEPTVTYSLTGQPVQPPNVEFRCPASGACNMPTATRSLCGGTMGAGGLSFGSVESGTGEACDLYMEIVNRKRSVDGNEVSVAPLNVDR
ncbi:MAG: hypothetical protein AAFU79_14475, partial [Myxococcota bacterium]